MSARWFLNVDRRFLLLLATGLTLVATPAVFLALRAKPMNDAAVVDRAPAPAGSERTAVTLDDRRQQLGGVRIAAAEVGTVAEVVRAPGTVVYDETRLVDINLKVSGWVRDLYIDAVGRHVDKGEALLSLFSPDVISVQAQYLAALRNRDQLASTPEADPTYVGRLVDSPKERLARWDVPADQMEVLDRTREIPAAVVFRAPASGTVIEKSVRKGTYVEAGRTLYTVADLSVVWVETDLREADAALVKVGDQAEIRLAALPNERIKGRIAYVAPSGSEQTRTVKARIEVSNQKGRLRPGLSAAVEIAAAPTEGILIPSDAVIDSGARQLVFVSLGQGRFEPRDVVVARTHGGRALVTDGLRPSERVAERATFFLDSESQLRATLQDYAGPSSPRHPAAREERFRVDVRFDPKPPRAGENVLELRVFDSSGRPVEGADVQARFHMPAMPSMNMPAMAATARLSLSQAGVYSGSVTFPMAGRWDLAVTVSRGGQPLGSISEPITVH
jgi:Cu(I)/Ag(I) efflux system membrane fusion protein